MSGGKGKDRCEAGKRKGRVKERRDVVEGKGGKRNRREIHSVRMLMDVQNRVDE